MTVIFILMMVLEVVLVLKYSRVAGAVVKYSHLNGVPVFGRVYKNVHELYLDQNFTNKLFSGAEFGDLADVKLLKSLILLRRLLLAQIIGGLMLFALGIIAGLSK